MDQRTVAVVVAAAAAAAAAVDTLALDLHTGLAADEAAAWVVSAAHALPSSSKMYHSRCPHLHSTQTGSARCFRRHSRCLRECHQEACHESQGGQAPFRSGEGGKRVVLQRK